MPTSVVPAANQGSKKYTHRTVFAPSRALCKAGLSWSLNPLRNQCTELTTMIVSTQYLIWNILECSHAPLLYYNVQNTPQDFHQVTPSKLFSQSHSGLYLTPAPIGCRVLRVGSIKLSNCSTSPMIGWLSSVGHAPSRSSGTLNVVSQTRTGLKLTEEELLSSMCYYVVWKLYDFFFSHSNLI